MLGGLRPLRQFRHTTGGLVPGYFARKVHDEIGTTAGQVGVCVCVSQAHTTHTFLEFNLRNRKKHLNKNSNQLNMKIFTIIQIKQS